MSVYKGMLEASVLTISESGEPVIPYYNQSTLETYIDNYLKENISKYTTKYTVKTAYFESNSQNICINYCRSVSINLKAKIYLFYDYNKTQTFVVRSAD